MYLRKVIFSAIISSFLLLSACSNSGDTQVNSDPVTPSENGQVSNESSEVLKSYEQAVKLYNEEKLDEALPLFEKSISQDSANGEYDYYIGNIYRKKNDLQKALTNYQNAFKKSPKLIEAYNNATAIQMATQNFDEALATADMGLKESPDFADLKFKKAQILYVKQQFHDAIPLLKELAKDTNYFEASRFLGYAYAGLNDKVNALEHLNEYLKQAPEGVPYRDKVKDVIAQLEK
ncbi:tetratricopeptide repeat protein [Brevibacillus panacihumi]|uniref:tetratricopeptide repeat protein n=1 Tax=Brevibacillus panacihumi TaxID=497735 RepID=UPI003D05DA72